MHIGSTHRGEHGRISFGARARAVLVAALGVAALLAVPCIARGARQPDDPGASRTMPSGVTNIALRASAAMQADRGLTLRDVATVSGPEADRLGAVVVLAQPRAGERVDVAMVRRALEAAPGGVNWARVAISGAGCAIRAGEPDAPIESNDARTARSTETRQNAADLAAPALPGSVREAVQLRLASLYDVDAGDVQLRFVRGGDARATVALLDSDVPEGQDLRVTPMTTANGSRASLRLDFYAADRLARTADLIADVTVRRNVFSATRTIERDEPLNADDLVKELRWMPAADPAALPADQIVGAQARRRIAAGKAITREDVQQPLATQRGEIVWVHTVKGGVVVKAKARAMGSARVGELVQLQLDGRRNAQKFSARMSEKGIAVMNLDAASDTAPAAPTTPAPTDTRPTPTKGPSHPADHSHGGIKR